MWWWSKQYNGCGCCWGRSLNACGSTSGLTHWYFFITSYLEITVNLNIFRNESNTKNIHIFSIYLLWFTIFNILFHFLYYLPFPPPTQFLFSLYLLNHLRVSYIHHCHSPLNIQLVFPKKRGILFHNRSIVITYIVTLITHFYCPLPILSVDLMRLYAQDPMWNHVFHLILLSSLASLNLKYISTTLFFLLWSHWYFWE